MRENRDQSDHGGRMEDARGRSFQADHGRIGMNKSILIRVAPARGNTKKAVSRDIDRVQLAAL
jgi:hypothetical protein